MPQSIAEVTAVLSSVAKFTWKETSLSAPQTVNHDGPKLFWRGVGNDLVNIADIPNGTSKKTSSERSIDAIPGAVFQNKLCIAWAGTDHRLNVMRFDDPKSKVTLNETSNYAPALAVFDQHLYLCWTGTDSRLNFVRSKDGVHFNDKITLDERTSNSPALTTFHDKLFMAWTGIDTRLNVLAAMSAGHSKVTLNETSIAGPTFADFGGQLFLGWTGTDNPHHLNTIRSNDGFNFFGKVISNETSNVGPALLSTPTPFGNVLLLCWTGTDNHLNVEQIDEIAQAKK